MSVVKHHTPHCWNCGDEKDLILVPDDTCPLTFDYVCKDCCSSCTVNLACEVKGKADSCRK
ncbi:hypothetical protein ES703_54698 [subsurface metagenome]